MAEEGGGRLARPLLHDKPLIYARQPIIPFLLPVERKRDRARNERKEKIDISDDVMMARAQCRDGMWVMGMVSQKTEGRDKRIRGKWLKKQR